MLQSHLGHLILFRYTFHLRPIQCESSKPKTQVSCQDTIRHFYFDNESMLYNEGGWTLVTRRRPHKKQESHPYPKEQHKQNIRRYSKLKKTQKKTKDCIS